MQKKRSEERFFILLAVQVPVLELVHDLPGGDRDDDVLCVCLL